MNELEDVIAEMIESGNSYGYYAHDRAVELAQEILSLPPLEELQEKAKLWEQFGIECSKCPTLKQARKYKEMMGDTNEDSKKLR